MRNVLRSVLLKIFRALPLLTLLLLALHFAAPQQTRAADFPSVWSALVLATNEDQPKSPPHELAHFVPKLEKIFGYNQFELIGQHTEKMDDPNECWLIPSKDFFLRVDTKTIAGKDAEKIGEKEKEKTEKADKADKGKEKEKTYVLKLALFQDTKQLLEFETKLASQSPLFIRGPMYAGGQLIIVLLVK